MEHLTLISLIIVVSAALIFDFLNGFHDAANTISTIVVTRTLTPGAAVLMAGAANFIGYFAFAHEVAKTIGKGVVMLDSVTLPLILGALAGAIVWNLITWLLGLPTSSSHALIGGLIGSGVAAAGWSVVIPAGVIKIVSFIFLAPLIGALGAAIFTWLIIWAFHWTHPKTADKAFKGLQLLSSLLGSIGHGTNDAQKTMGVIAMALVAAGVNSTFKLDNWVVLSCYAAISLGTMFGGWRIVRTMGTGITKIRPMEGFTSGASAAVVLLGTAHFGIPVSTTHVIAGSIMGVGAVEHAGQVRWITARKILWSWILTIPCTAVFAALAYFAIHLVIK
jgi:inorganic phosphate transporter, PiT family